MLPVELLPVARPVSERYLFEVLVKKRMQAKPSALDGRARDESIAPDEHLRQNEQHQHQRYYRSAAEHKSDDGNYALGAYKADEKSGDDEYAAACDERGQSAVERKAYRLAARNIALPQLKIAV